MKTCCAYVMCKILAVCDDCKKLTDRNYTCIDVVTFAASEGHIECLRYLIETAGMEVSDDAYITAKENDNEEIVKYLTDNNYCNNFYI